MATVQTNISSFTTTFALRERRKSGYLKMREIHLLYWATCGSVPGRGGRSGRGHRCQTPTGTGTRYALWQFAEFKSYEDARRRGYVRIERARDKFLWSDGGKKSQHCGFASRVLIYLQTLYFNIHIRVWQLIYIFIAGYPQCWGFP